MEEVMMTESLIGEIKHCREVFEAKADHAYSTRKIDGGFYEDRDTEAAWQGGGPHGGISWKSNIVRFRL
jgi:hypothetical protein